MIVLSLIVGTAVLQDEGLFLPTIPSGGQEAPDIPFELNGRHTSLKEHRGKVVLLNFWASWCGPCMSEMPSLARLERRLGPEGLEVLAFNVQESEVTDRVTAAEMPHNLIYEFPHDRLRAYPFSGIPATFLIDKEGIAKRVYHGPMDWMNARILKEIEALL
jgi:thiol-disulfide isomerase/thioredoxin